MAEKVTEMTLQVDLQCPCCYKKVKKLLCQFPQIRDQLFDEKNNIVRINGVCCNPEKIRDKLCCKGGKVIKCIVIVEPDPKPEKQPDPKPEKQPDPKPEKKPDPKPPPKPVPAVSVQVSPTVVCCAQCYEGHPGEPCYHRCGRPVPPPCYCYPYAYGYNMGCNVSRCDLYFSDNNPSACSIM